ncbi:MAG: hypothetical protein IJB82_02445 [Bacilli bacterium]|nr:hypothetical protein [Bacilli bacterium]
MKKRKAKILKGEKLLYFLIGFLLLANIVGQSFSMAMLSKTNFDVENMKSKIEEQESLNESLTMKINELASLDNIDAVASLYGLGYNNNNIKVVND